MVSRRILLTGASGNIGRKLSSGLRERYEALLLDRNADVGAGIEHADFTRFRKDWVRHFTSVDVVLHLAANPHTDANWSELIPDNIDSVLNVCTACVRGGVRRLLFASSCQTMEGYRDQGADLITVDLEPRPVNSYGVSKMVGERICRHYADRHRLSVVCLRIGWVPTGGDQVALTASNAWLKRKWLSEKDLVQVFSRSIEAEGVDFGIFYAVSGNARMRWDLDPARRVLGYQPEEGIRGS
jgi:nucleoside-diphosphate-sugar epimerase